jgi:esterase/lipase superfamily enzyme
MSCAYRLVIIMSAICLGTASAQGQPSSEGLIPDACRHLSGDALSELQARRTTLENEVKRARDEDLRKSREDLLEVIYQIECRSARSAPTERAARPRSRGGPASKSNEVLEITTYYATNRKQSNSPEPDKVYGSEFEGQLRYGRAIVTIPATHTPGNLELPSWWKFEREADPSKHFVLKSVIPLTADAARKEMAENAKALLVFVHGYNTGFTEAALRTAQMAYDLAFPGTAFFYSWPSANSVRAYWHDEEMAQRSVRVFEQLIEELSRLPASNIYIVAHSMGSRIVGHALERHAAQGKETKNLKGLLLAAPDINADLFRDDIAPKLAAMRGMQTTIYASSSDVALLASSFVHGFRRVGETAGGVFAYQGLETIDASNASAMTRGFGHFYLVDSPSVLKDIHVIIEKKLSAKLRGLLEAGAPPNSYYQLQ